VLRRILRRAVRYGRQYLNMHDPFLCDLVRPLAEHMGQAFPELRKSAAYGDKNAERVAEMLRGEEESFGRTLDRGIQLFNEAYRRAIARSAVPRAVPYGEPSLNFDAEVERAVADWEAQHPRIWVGRPRISGEDAFKLHDTYGFPIDLTELMAEERGLTVNIGEYERLMDSARERARAKVVQADDEAYKRLTPGECDDSPKYEEWRRCFARLVSLARAVAPYESDSAKEGGNVVFSTDRTCFYAEQGGQVSDRGFVRTESGEIHVESIMRHTVRLDLSDGPRDVQFFSHSGVVASGEIWPGQQCEMSVSPDHRIPTMQNHTSTHILNWALRDVLGGHVQQKGSLVDPEKTRFDFSHPKPLSAEELQRIEALVNERIDQALDVDTNNNIPVDQQAARRINTLRAVFGEKYPDQVRVVSIGPKVTDLLADPTDARWMQYSVEFCGGTHVKNTSEINCFALTHEESVAKGVRRVVGISGEAARRAEALGAELLAEAESLSRIGDRQSTIANLAEHLAELQRRLTEAVIPVTVRMRIRDLLADVQKVVKEQEKEAAGASADAVHDQVAKLLEQAETVGGVTLVVGQVPEAGADALRAAIDWVRNKTAASAVVLATAQADNVTLIAGMSREAVARGLKAGDVIKEIAPLVGGKGGGRPDMAQGGGREPSGVPAALERARTMLRERFA